ncbi:MAG: ABC transporter permease subunit [Chloroflexota bacterium]
MRNIWTIAKREYKLYFNGPVAYAVAFLFFLILGITFFQSLRDALQSALFQQPYTPTIQVITGGVMVFILIFTTPAITMRLLAEEQRSGTMELLLTAPVRDWELVLGKWLGGVLFMLTLILTTLIYAVVLNWLVEPGIDQGLLISGYLGLSLMTMSLISIGVAVSAFFSNQIAAFFASLVIVLALWLTQAASSTTGTTVGEVVKYFNFIEHYIGFFNGVIDLRDVVYYLSFTAVGLFVGNMAVEMRRWR